MTILNEIIEYISNCKNILHQISIYGDKLEFETWIYSGIIKISDQFILKTPNVYFDIVKYNVPLGDTKYRFTLHSKSVFMEYPKHRKLFNRLCAPTIFKACMKKYKRIGKQK